jgi:hypothetical protein
VGLDGALIPAPRAGPRASRATRRRTPGGPGRPLTGGGSSEARLVARRRAPGPERPRARAGGSAGQRARRFGARGPGPRRLPWPEAAARGGRLPAGAGIGSSIPPDRGPRASAKLLFRHGARGQGITSAVRPRERDVEQPDQLPQLFALPRLAASRPTPSLSKTTRETSPSGPGDEPQPVRLPGPDPRQRPTGITTGHSRPFAECDVIRFMASPAGRP